MKRRAAPDVEPAAKRDDVRASRIGGDVAAAARSVCRSIVAHTSGRGVSGAAMSSSGERRACSRLHLGAERRGRSAAARRSARARRPGACPAHIRRRRCRALRSFALQTRLQQPDAAKEQRLDGAHRTSKLFSQLLAREPRTIGEDHAIPRLLVELPKAVPQAPPA